MSVIWRTKISVLDIKRENVSVTLEQIDDTDIENIKILKSFCVLDALIDTPERKQQVFTELERQYNQEKQDADTKTKIIGTLGEDIIAAVANWEIE